MFGQRRGAQTEPVGVPPVATPLAAPPPPLVAPSPAVPLPPTGRSLDPGEAERVLRRAIALSALVPDPAGGDNRLPVEVLHQVASELAIDASALAHALAEQRAAGPDGRPLDARTIVDRIFGPGQVSAVHSTALSPGLAVDHLDQWLTRRHHLRVRHPATDLVVAERRRGVLPAVTHNVRAASGTAGLATARQVRATVAGAGADATSVCLVADVRNHRNRSVVAGTVVAAGTSVVVSVAAVLTAPVTLAGLPAAVGTGWAVARLSHRRQVNRVRTEVEITAEQVTSGALPPTRIEEVVTGIAGHLSRPSPAGRRSRGPAPSPAGPR